MDNKEIDLQELLDRKYSVVVIESPYGRGYAAKITALAGCTSFGMSPEEVMAGIEESKQNWIRDAVADGFGIPAPAPKDVSEEERINTELLSNPMKEMIAWLNEQGITKIVPYRTEAANGIRIYFD